MLLARHIGHYKARIAAQAARKTSWAAPEAPSWLRRVEHWLRPLAPSGDPLQLLPWELTSPAALEVDSSHDGALLSYAGVVVRRNAVCRDAVAACRARAEELAAEATRRATARLGFRGSTATARRAPRARTRITPGRARVPRAPRTPSRCWRWRARRASAVSGTALCPPPTRQSKSTCLPSRKAAAFTM